MQKASGNSVILIIFKITEKCKHFYYYFLCNKSDTFNYIKSSISDKIKHNNNAIKKDQHKLILIPPYAFIFSHLYFSILSYQNQYPKPGFRPYQAFHNNNWFPLYSYFYFDRFTPFTINFTSAWDFVGSHTEIICFFLEFCYYPKSRSFGCR